MTICIQEGKEEEEKKFDPHFKHLLQSQNYACLTHADKKVV